MPDLDSLEAPYIEEANARSELTTLQSLIETTPHEGARKAIQADLPRAQKRLTDAIAARQGAESKGLTRQSVDQAAQAEIDAREPVEAEED